MFISHMIILELVNLPDAYHAGEILILSGIYSEGGGT